jgi:hypothetical protein
MLRIALVALLSLGASTPKREALFNGRDLTNFYTWLAPKPGEKEPIGKNADPLGVFKVQDGVIHVSGEVFGYFATEKEYENYRLVVEFKWGEKTWAPRKDKARDSGILFHVTGEDKVWPKSIEYQIIEGGTGDILFVGGTSMEFEESLLPRFAAKKETMLSPDGKRITKGRVNWEKRAKDWKDVVNFRGPDDLEKPLGEWNTMELICYDGAFTYLLNGQKVAEGKGAEPRKGRIVLQSEGAEIFFRKVDIFFDVKK